MEAVGRRLAEGVNEVVADAGLQGSIEVLGHPSCLVFVTRDARGAASQAYRTLFLQELLDRGVLGQSFVVSAAHSDTDIDLTIEAVRAALPIYREAIDAGAVDGLLRGRPVAPAIRRYAFPRRVDGSRPAERTARE